MLCSWLLYQGVHGSYECGRAVIAFLNQLFDSKRPRFFGQLAW